MSDCEETSDPLVHVIHFTKGKTEVHGTQWQQFSQCLSVWFSHAGYHCRWELDCQVGWVPKNWCFWTVVLEKTLESPLDIKEIQPVYPKGNQSWIFTGGIDAEAEAPILWPSDVKNWLTGKDWRREEKGIPEDEMVGWHHWLDGHEFELTPGVGDGQGSLACCSPWGCKELDMTERLNWTEVVHEVS